MAEKLFDRETILDLTVNFIPLGILLLFVVIYLVFTPFGFNSVISSIQFAIIGVMFAGLAILTYYSGAAISRAEKESEAEESALEASADPDPELDDETDGELEAGTEEAGTDDGEEEAADEAEDTADTDESA